MSDEEIKDAIIRMLSNTNCGQAKIILHDLIKEIDDECIQYTNYCKMKTIFGVDV